MFYVPPEGIRTGAWVSPGKGHSRIRPMAGRVDLETRGRQRVLQSHRLEGFGAGRGDVRQMPCAFEPVLQVDAGERCGQLAQIRGWGADQAGQRPGLADCRDAPGTPAGDGDEHRACQPSYVHVLEGSSHHCKVGGRSFTLH